MVEARSLTTVALVLGLTGSPLLAQTADAPAQEQAPESTRQVETEDGVSPATAPPGPANDDDPFDYESSEEISEDLSVSFPVDI
jgi:hypothetical protein